LADCKTGCIAGIDEAGRGPLAGPVVAGAVILNPNSPIRNLADSKVLTEKRRERLAEEILLKSVGWSVAWSDSTEIDQINILQATFLAMRRAIIGLRVVPARVQVDGNQMPNLEFGEHQICGDAFVRGDSRIPAISAASIIAKVYRDRMMRRIDKLYPGYGFANHKGYGTEHHRSAILALGPCPQHRRSFKLSSI
jgi:ribonuclease HII